MKTKIIMRPKEKITRIPVTTDYIKLDSFLKLANEVGTGGEAKLVISEGKTRVNGEVCCQRGKKLRVGDKVLVNGRQFEVADGNVH